MVTLDDSRTALDYDDRVLLKVGQLTTLLTSVSGDRSGCFHGLPRDLQDSFLGLLQELAGDAMAAMEEAGRLRLAARDQTAH
ncbi:hypothetical protein KIH07_18515 [Hydrogenophaga taeniospiralis]|uniref:hypothetical protein n=1 Tax=Hydrogenophaga taeniospiralis TaxID=65656 RepID=UPI001CFAD108|nr:hypothetical protein [Hydrogenophaga taeniospiralis]MCB4365734.1 hypothetical protein [Hydrogenophaga taeniospiralis]